jgi:hypothetical protein
MNLDKIKPLHPIAEKFVCKKIGKASIFYAFSKEQNGNKYFVSGLCWYEAGEYKEQPATVGELVLPALKAIPGAAKIMGELDNEILKAVMSMEPENGFFAKVGKNNNLEILTGIIYYNTNLSGSGLDIPLIKGAKRRTLRQLIESL